MGVTIDDEFTGSSEPKSDRGKPSAASQLVELALERYEFGRTEEGQQYAVKPGGHVVRMLRGGKNSLRAEMSTAYFKKYGKAAPQQALADALLVLEGQAQGEDPTKVHLRVASAKGAIWLDLGDAAETAVRIDGDGWRVVNDNIPVLFQRTALTGVMPVPQRGGDLGLLWEQLNVAPADRPLVEAWMIAAIAAPNVPHPVLSLFGEQGTGKSTATKNIVGVVDPSPVPLRKPPRDSEAWVTAAQGSWVVGLDNLSHVPDWLSDSLCRAATGEGDVRRALYTDGGLAVFAFRRCIVLNGIDVGALRGDLVDRIAHVDLERISNGARKEEEELAEQWQETYPLILGALLAGVAEVIKRLPSVRLATKPRMADFARVLAAVDQIRGTTGLKRFADQARTMAEDSLSADPFLAKMDAAQPNFEGTSVQLLAEMSVDLPPRIPKDWPKTARDVTSLLARQAPALRKAGWTVEKGEDKHNKMVQWTIVHPEKVGKEHPRHPQDPQDHSESDDSAGVAGVAGIDYGQSQDGQPSANGHAPASAGPCDLLLDGDYCGNPDTRRFMNGWRCVQHSPTNIPRADT
jgi:hypothetical protein